VPKSDLFIDPVTLERNALFLDVEGIRKILPQRHEMEQLSGIYFCDVERGLAAGYKDVLADEFWVRGHLPGRPLLPGVIMLEAGAQLSAILYHVALGAAAAPFIGYAGLEDVRFRGTVEPGDRLDLFARVRALKPRLAVFETQGAVGDRLVFEAVVKGVPI
jgi:3-hydroxyacyl-[acyl-carrier-protein] dehydratase